MTRLHWIAFKRDGGAADERARMTAAQEPQSQEGHQHRGRHHLEEVGALEREHRANRVGARDLPPRDQEADRGPAPRRCDAWLHPVTALIAKLAAMAVAMKVI